VRDLRQEFEASVTSVFDVMAAAQGRAYTSLEMEEFLAELGAAHVAALALLTGRSDEQSVLERAARRLRARALGEP